MNVGWTCAPAPGGKAALLAALATATAQLSWPTSLHRTGPNLFSKRSRLFLLRPGQCGPVMVVKWVQSNPELLTVCSLTYLAVVLGPFDVGPNRGGAARRRTLATWDAAAGLVEVRA